MNLGPCFRPGMKIGLFGGSFNPAHAGHRAISEVALKRLGLDYVVWLVSPQNPLKTAKGMANYEARFGSAVAAANHPRITVSRFEKDNGIQYTADTIIALQQKFPLTKFVYIIGADNFIQLPRWKAWTQLMETIPFAIFARPGWDRRAVFSKAAHRYRAHRLPEAAASRLVFARPPAWVFITSTQFAHSSTKIRAAGGWR